MRLFYDLYTTRRHAEVLLLLADSVTAVSAILFATGLLAVPGRGPDAALAVAWILIPRATASFLAWFERPRAWLRNAFLGAGLGVVIVLLAYTGWSLLWETGPRHPTSRPETAIVILLAWGSAFLVCVPRAYRLNDFLLVAVVLLALLERKPGPYLWIPLFTLAFLLSAAVRHLLHNVFSETRDPPVNLQNVRVLAAGAALLTLLAFFPTASWLSRWLDGWGRDEWGLAARYWPIPTMMRSSPGRGADGVPTRPPPGAAGSHPFSPSGRAAREPRGRRSERGIGYSRRVALSDLAAPRYDRRAVLRATLVDEADEAVPDPPPAWQPTLFLWKGVSFSRFDAATASWVEESGYRREGWPKTGLVATPAATSSAEVLRIRLEVLAPVFRSLVAPYLLEGFEPPVSGRDGGYYLVNDLGDVVPRAPGIAEGMVYHARVAPVPAAIGVLPNRLARGLHPDRRYLDIPETAEIGVHLGGLVEREGLRGASLQETVNLLRRFLRGRFLYSDRATWTGTALRLRAFLFRERVGDCAYFATATALLLRAAGVSTRVAVGFLGGEVRPTRPGEVVIRNATAHSWVEVWGDDRWYPIDPTYWVDAVHPPDDGEEIADGGLGAEGEEGGVLRRGGLPEPEGGPPRRSPSDDRVPRRRPVGATRSTDGGMAAGSGKDRWDPDGLLGDDVDQDISWVRWGALPDDPDGDSTGSLTRAGGERAAGSDPASLSPSPASLAAPAGTLLERALRLSILVAFACAALLALLSLLRPRKRTEDGGGDDPEEQDEELGPVTFVSGDPANGADEPLRPRDRVLEVYRRLQSDLSRVRRHRLPHQTPVEHARRYDDHHETLEDAFSSTTRTLYDALYRDASVDERDVEEIRRSARTIRRHLG